MLENKKKTENAIMLPEEKSSGKSFFMMYFLHLWKDKYIGDHWKNHSTMKDRALKIRLMSDSWGNYVSCCFHNFFFTDILSVNILDI